jgi:hypothetical protein
MNVVDITGVAKNAENYLLKTLAEIKFAEEVLGCIIVAWCTDGSGESLKMRKLLRQLMPWIIESPCWSHQVRFEWRSSLGRPSNISFRSISYWVISTRSVKGASSRR